MVEKNDDEKMNNVLYPSTQVLKIDDVINEELEKSEVPLLIIIDTL